MLASAVLFSALLQSVFFVRIFTVNTKICELLHLARWNFLREHVSRYP